MSVSPPGGAALLAAGFDYGYGAPAFILIYAVAALAIGAAIGARVAESPDPRSGLLVLVPLAAWLAQVVLGVDPFAAAVVLTLAVFALPVGYAVGRRVGRRRASR